MQALKAWKDFQVGTRLDGNLLEADPQLCKQS